MAFNILVVDDDIIQRKLVGEIVSNHMGQNVMTAESGSEAVDLIVSQKGHNIDLVLLDISMPGMNGIDVLKTVKPQRPDLPIIMVTSSNDISLAVQCIRAGAIDFIVKHAAPERLKLSIENSIKINVLEKEVSRLKRSIEGQVFFTDILGTSKAINHSITLAKRAATSSIPVFIEGENGVGKELFARAIHGSSARSEKPFIAVNCGAIPENLAESILFGHERGAFTGAIYKSLGKFREANGGTIFLDEVGELKPDLQVKLLRVIQESEVEAVGGKNPVKIDVRVISATNRNIDEMVDREKFREDLYYRLKVFPLSVPPLRERKEDIGELLDYFCGKFSVLEAKKILGLTDIARALLQGYAWPGNIRELQNAVFRAIILCDKEYIDVDDFPILKKFTPVDFASNNNNNIETAPIETAASYSNNFAFMEQSGNFRKIAEIEGQVIKSALEYYDWHISEVARRLGIGRSTLYRKMDELGIIMPRPPGALKLGVVSRQ